MCKSDITIVGTTTCRVSEKWNIGAGVRAEVEGGGALHAVHGGATHTCTGFCTAGSPSPSLAIPVSRRMVG